MLVELAIMALLQFAQSILPSAIPGNAWWLVDPILLVAILAPILIKFFFRPMQARQAELERQLDELYRFHKLTVGRELRMKELVEENETLRDQLARQTPESSSS